ncbi:site-specific integrase [Ferrovibrio sp.]|uniref:site-specific integrase n=1 Tax=Ferrovibrio sp. TaxID=1917215 RepID=UPI0026160825|nr:site-specific integrase [Ferrovibrio sp.]
MALSTNLVRRGGIYYFRCRVPNDLVARLGRTELSRSLATANPDVARRRGRWAAHLVEQVWLLVRECMSPEQIDDVIRRWLKAELDKDEVARTNTAFAGDYAARHGVDVKAVAREMIGSDAAAQMDEWQRHALDARWEEAQPWANTIIRDQGLPIEKGSDNYRLLCLRLLPALADFHGIRLERSEGNWSHQIALPSAPMVAPELLPSPKKGGQPLKDAIGEYLTSLKRPNGPIEKRIMEIRGSLNLFSGWLGEDTAITAVDRATMGRFLMALEKLPPNWTKRFKGKTIHEVLEAIEGSGEKPLRSNTINGHLGVLTGFFDWCISTGQLEAGTNPAVGIRAKGGHDTAPENQRASFTAEEVHTLFQSPLYTGCRSERFATTPGTQKPRNWKFWILLIAVFTGTRISEICQLRPEDIREVHGVWCFRFNTKAGKRLKTKASTRDLPIHHELVKIGLLKLAQSRKGQKELLPDVPEAVYGVPGHKPSRWGIRYLTRILGKTNEDGEKYVNHGLRHTMETKLRETEGVEEWMQHAIMGHKYHHISDRYGKKPVQRLAAAMQRVDFGVDFSHLYLEGEEQPTRES